MVIFGGSYGIGADIATFAARPRRRGVHLQPLLDQHPRRAARPTSAGRDRRRCWPRPTASTSWSTPRPCCPAGNLVETSEETIYAATEINYLAPVLLAQEFFPHLRAHPRQPAELHLQLLHPRAQRLQPLLLGEGGRGQPDPGAGRRVVRRRRARSTASTPSAPAPRCAPRRSARSRPGTLLESTEVARRSLDVLISGQTGLIIDIRRDDPLDRRCRLHAAPTGGVLSPPRPARRSWRRAQGGLPQERRRVGRRCVASGAAGSRPS